MTSREGSAAGAGRRLIRVHDLAATSPAQTDAWLSRIAANLRASDLDEIAATSALPPLDALRVSVRHSRLGWVVTDRSGEPVAAFGVSPHPLPGVGVVWMLGTDGIDREARPIARATRPYLATITAAFPIVWNFIDERNEKSMRWLRWGGFEVIGGTTMGPQDRPFHIFAKVAR